MNKLTPQEEADATEILVAAKFALETMRDRGLDTNNCISAAICMLGTLIIAAHDFEGLDTEMAVSLANYHLRCLTGLGLHS